MLGNLAELLRDTNQLLEAASLMRRTLKIDEAEFGSKHPRVAERLNSVAILLSDTGRAVEAEPLARRALSIDEQAYGAEHPKVAIRL